MSRAISILISAMGGEGGGVLAAWLSNAAVEAGLPVQRTSIPGVAQRTGSTTYYIELFPVTWSELASREPNLGLHPSESGVDMIVASELLEAARALHRGYAARDRTLLIASTHRVYTISEKAAAAHGRFNERTAYDALAAMTCDAIHFDCQAVARAAGSHINAVLLGAIAGSGRLPIPESAFRNAIEREGKLTVQNLRGFDAGLDAAARKPNRRAKSPDAADELQQGQSKAGPERDFPEDVWPTLREAIARLSDYQDASYAQRYLDRLRPIRDLDRKPFELSESTARYLALWMSYEDVIRVAQLKTRPSRLRRIRREQGAAANEPVVIVDYLKPGVTEFCSVLPTWIGRRVMRVVARRGLEQKFSLAVRIRTSSVLGFARMRALALLKFWRPWSYGFHEEQRQIEWWLELVRAAASRDLAFAAEIAHCAKLVRGYADTRQRGYARLRRIVDAVIDPLLADPQCPAPTDFVRRARIAALSDDSGSALEAELKSFQAEPAFTGAEVAGKPLEEVSSVDGR